MDNKGKQEAIVEQNESEQGSRPGCTRARLSLCLSSALKSTDREENQELQGFLRYPYQVKDMIEHNSYCKEKECVIRIQMEGHPFATALYRARTGDKKNLSSGFRWKVTFL